MALTPADVHNVAFSKPPIGKRGYNEDEVDQFLDLVEDTLAEIQDKNDELRQQVEILEAELEEARSGVMPSSVSSAPSVSESAIRAEVEAKLKNEYEAKLAAAQSRADRAESDAREARAEAEAARAATPEVSPITSSFPSSDIASADTHMQAAKVLGLAQEMADRMTSEAQAESRSMLDDARTAAEKQISSAEATARATLEDARIRSERQISEAQATADRLVTEAEAKSNQTLTDAHSRAEAQIKAAEDKANALQADAERKHTEIMATVKQQQSALETRIAELRTFEREYRTRLKTLLQSSLEELESRGSAQPGSTDINA